MNYWVLKGNPRENNLAKMLDPGQSQLWRSKKIPKVFTREDRLFCWESSPKRKMVGLATVTNPSCGSDKNGNHFFEIRYNTYYLHSQPSIEELRKIPILTSASFLKSGPASAIHKLVSEQAKILLSLLKTRNPEIVNLWVKQEKTFNEFSIPDIDYIDIDVAIEGNEMFVTHLRRERNKWIIDKKKRQVLSSTGKLACEACEFDFFETYGEFGREFCEVHHLIPLSSVNSEVETSLADLAIVCSNCHRIIHRNKNLSVNELGQLLRMRRNK